MEEFLVGVIIVAVFLMGFLFGMGAGQEYKREKVIELCQQDGHFNYKNTRFICSEEKK